MTATYTMNDFINNKLAVRVNKDNILDFLKMCEEKGLVWASGEKATYKVPFEAKCIAFGFDSENTLTYSYDNESAVYAAHGYAFVDFSQIINSTAYQIIIESDGDTTTAKMVINGKEIKTATAKRNPADKPNWHIGAQTAFDRLWQKKEKPEKPVEKEKDGFKVGDRVVCVGFQHDCYGKHGHIVTILNDTTGLVPFGVEFDEPVCGGHDCGGTAKSGCGRWFYVRELSHEQKVRKVKRRAKAGEYIELINGGYTFDKIGQIMRVNKVTKCAQVLQKDHPAFDATDAHSNPNFTWTYGDWEYVVLEGYRP